jgi:hypothetical protein
MVFIGAPLVEKQFMVTPRFLWYRSIISADTKNRISFFFVDHLKRLTLKIPIFSVGFLRRLAKNG